MFNLNIKIRYNMRIMHLSETTQKLCMYNYQNSTYSLNYIFVFTITACDY